MVLLTALVACSRDDGSVQPPRTQPDGPQVVRIGALIPETGPAAATGVAARWLLEQRLDQLNAEYVDQELSYTFELDVVDTESDSTVAQEAFSTLADDGVKVVVGPFSDAEVKAVRDLANERGVLVGSPGSSAISLALHDNVLRFVPDDRVQAAAIVDLMRRDDIRTISQIGRDDPTNDELQAAIATDFVTLGGGATEPVAYAPDATSFASPVSALSEGVAGALDVVGSDHSATVGVVVAGEDEVPQLLTLAAAAPLLADVRWFGSNGFARSPAIVANPSAAAFAQEVGLPSATFGLDPAAEDRWGPLVREGREQTGVTPDAMALAAYDTLGVLVAAIVESVFPAVDATTADVRDLRTAAISQSLTIDGVTGPLKLNEFGDRTTGVFDFWSVCAGPTAYDWRRSAVWTPGPDGLAGGTITGTATC